MTIHKSTISIVIPVYNEEDTLGDLFSSLENQSILPREIIFIDSGSSDKSIYLIEQWIGKFTNLKGRIYLLRNPGGLPGENRNLGIKFATSEWIALLDAGIKPTLNWLESLLKEVQEKNAKAIFGKCQFDSFSGFGKGVCAQSYGCNNKPIMPASLYHRSIFEDVGLFHEEIRAAEDLLWMQKFHRKYPNDYFFTKNIVSLYSHFPTTLSSIIKKWWDYQLSTIKFGFSTYKIIFLYLNILLISFSFFISNKVGWISLAGYLLFRCIFEPIRRSKKLFWWKPTTTAFFWAIIIGITIDLTIITASIFYFICKFKKILNLHKH